MHGQEVTGTSYTLLPFPMERTMTNHSDEPTGAELLYNVAMWWRNSAVTSLADVMSDCNCKLNNADSLGLLGYRILLIQLN